MAFRCTPLVQKPLEYAGEPGQSPCSPLRHRVILWLRDAPLGWRATGL